MANIRTLKLNLLADTENFGKNLKKASGQSDSFAKKLGKNFALAGAAIGGAAIAIGVDAVKAAIDDQKSQKLLAVALKNTTKASKNSVKAVEDWISAQQMAYGISDEKLRPALGKLVRATGDVRKSQDLLSRAMDISAGTGKDLGAVTDALVRAQNGNLSSLKKLGIPLDDTIIKNKDLAAALKIADDRFKGAAKAAGDTMAGKLEKFKISIDEAKESIGNAILNALQPLAEKWLPKISTGIGHFIDGLVGGTDNGGIKGAAKDSQTEIYNLGETIRKFFKTLNDNKGLLQTVATAIGAIFIGAKASAATALMITALKDLRAAFALTTIAAGTTAAAEAAATGGASLAVAAPAIIGIATALGIAGLSAMWAWKGNGKATAKQQRDASAAAVMGKVLQETGVGAGGYGGTQYGTPLENSGGNGWGGGKRGFKQGTTIINLNGIVDAESARRSIESLLQSSSIRTGAVNFNRAVI